MQHILDQASVVDQKTEMIPALRIGQRAAAAETHALADPEALELLKQDGTNWYRTDLEGDIAIAAREGQIRVVTRR